MHLIFVEKRLDAADNEVKKANLDQRLRNLDELKNLQNQSKKKYEFEIDQLIDEVNQVKLISEALPNGCYKIPPRLEVEP